MLATFINVILVLAGSAVGLLFQNLISQRLTAILTQALGLCVLGVGIGNLIGTQDMLCVIVCMTLHRGVCERLPAVLRGGHGHHRLH